MTSELIIILLSCFEALIDVATKGLILKKKPSFRSLALTEPKPLSLCHSRYNEASKVNERDQYVPLCDSDGSYKQIQCNSATGECWCVDGDGKEKQETRKIGKPICDSQGTP